jgi:hypothetical protein
MSQLADSCSAEGSDCEGEHLDELLFMTDEQMEATREFIQWI